VLTSLLAAGISYSIPLLVWRHVYAASPHAPPIPAAQLFAYLLLGGCLNFALGMSVEFRVGQRIRTGMIATDLLKPIDFQVAQLSQALSDALFNVLLCGPIWFVGLVTLRGEILPASTGSLLASLLSIVLAFVIMFSISFVFVQAAFFTNSGYGIFAARSALQQTFSGLSAPLALFPWWMRATSEWLPFRHTIHTPIAIYLGWVSGGEVARLLALQLGWAVLLFLLGRVILAAAFRRLEIQGG
jgi:ABC-2 type transport system permease protein